MLYNDDNMGDKINMKKRTRTRLITYKGILAGFFNKLFFKKFGFTICSLMVNIKRKRKEYIYNTNDNFRLSSLELVANEIYKNNIKGNVAELGVFRGDFAKFINLSFPDRKLYLFDTFEGFDEKDIFIEYKNNNTPPR